MSIECFFKNHQHTFSGIGAIATAAAVWIALRQNKPKAKVLLDYNESESGAYHKIRIINRGTVPFKIDRRSFVVKMPFSKMVNIFCYDFHSSRAKEPLTVEINDSVELHLMKTDDKSCKDYLMREMSGVKKLLLKFARMKLITTGGISFRVRASGRLISDLENISKEKKL